MVEGVVHMCYSGVIESREGGVQPGQCEPAVQRAQQQPGQDLRRSVVMREEDASITYTQSVAHHAHHEEQQQGGAGHQPTANCCCPCSHHVGRTGRKSVITVRVTAAVTAIGVYAVVMKQCEAQIHSVESQCICMRGWHSQRLVLFLRLCGSLHCQEALQSLAPESIAHGEDKQTGREGVAVEKEHTGDGG